jgi:hypothetical protein
LHPPTNARIAPRPNKTASHLKRNALGVVGKRRVPDRPFVVRIHVRPRRKQPIHDLEVLAPNRVVQRRLPQVVKPVDWVPLAQQILNPLKVPILRGAV